MENSVFSDKPEQLANDGYILVRNIVKARRGEDFKYYPCDEKMPITVKDVDLQEFYRCYNFYHKFQVLGLPHGKGWIHETPDCSHVLILFDGWVKQATAWFERKAARA